MAIRHGREKRGMNAEIEVWKGDERRRTSPLTMRELEEHIDDRIRKRLEEHSNEEALRMDRRFDEIKTLLASAFPGGDPSEHRRYHDEVITFIHERRELFRSIREKTLTGLVWFILIGLGTAVWQYIRTKLGQ